MGGGRQHPHSHAARGGAIRLVGAKANRCIRRRFGTVSVDFRHFRHFNGLNGLNVLVFPELRNSETRERSESYVEDLGTLAEATRSRRRIAWTVSCMVMCELAVNTYFSTRFPVKVKDMEVFRPRAMFTYDMLIQLKQDNPDCDFMYVVGSDWLQPGANIRSWRSTDPTDPTAVTTTAVKPSGSGRVGSPRREERGKAESPQGARHGRGDAGGRGGSRSDQERSGGRREGAVVDKKATDERPHRHRSKTRGRELEA